MLQGLKVHKKRCGLCHQKHVRNHRRHAADALLKVLVAIADLHCCRCGVGLSGADARQRRNLRRGAGRGARQAAAAGVGISRGPAPLRQLLPGALMFGTTRFRANLVVLYLHIL